MAIIFAGGELSSFTAFNALETTTVGSFAVPARCGIHTQKNGYIRTDMLADVTEIYLHFDMSIGLISAGLTPILVTNSTGVALFSISSSGVVTAMGTVIGTIPLITTGRFTVDIHLRGGSSGTGLVEVYADSQVMLSVVGSFAFTGIHSLILSPTGSDATAVTNTVYSQIIAANELLIGSKLATLVLSTIGSNNSWVGSTSDSAATVNAIGLDTTTYISAQTAGLVETWVTSDIDPQYTNVRAVIISALGKYSTSGPKNLDACTRINAANYFTAMTTLGPGYLPSQAIFSINPVTNAAWTVSDVNAAEFGFRSKV